MCLTGGRGFLGSHILGSIAAAPGTVFHVLSRALGGRPAPAEPDGTRAFAGNLAAPAMASDFVVPGAVVVNLVYLKGDSIQDNLAAVDFLAERCLRGGARRLIHCSTAVVVGSTPVREVDEETICRPCTPYETCKLAIEAHLRQACRGRLDLAIIRPTAVFGAGGQNLRSTVDFVRHAGQGYKRLRTAAFASRQMNLVSAENVAACVHHIAGLDDPVEGRCFIVSEDDQPENTFGGVCRLIHEALGMAAPAPLPIPFRELIQRAVLRLFKGPSAVPFRRYRTVQLDAVGFHRPYRFAERVRHYALQISGR